MAKIEWDLEYRDGTPVTVRTTGEYREAGFNELYIGDTGIGQLKVQGKAHAEGQTVGRYLPHVVRRGGSVGEVIIVELAHTHVYKCECGGRPLISDCVCKH